MSEEAPHVVWERRERVALVTLNRPERMNAFTWRMARELDAIFKECDADDSIRALVVTGAGRAYCAGADLALAGGTFEDVAVPGDDQPPKQPLQPWRMRKPVIAAIQGPAVGVGLTMPLQYDMRFAAEDAKLGFVFVSRGVMPELASTWILPRLVGVARAADLLLSGRILRGAEAAQLGLVNEALPREEVLPRALEVAEQIAVHTAPVSVALTKRMLWEHLGVEDPEAAARREGKAVAWLGRQADAREGVVAFLERRAPEWELRASTDTPEL